MNTTERRQCERLARRAREQRNATKSDEDFDYWHGVYEHYLLLLKTECDAHHTIVEHKCDGHHIPNP
jgi:hypothetical protein